MSRPRGVPTTRWVLLGLVALACPVGASGQFTDGQLRERLDSLRPVLEQASIAAELERAAAAEAMRIEAREEVEQTQVPLERLRIGPLHVLAFADQVDLARDIFEEVWEQTYSNIAGSPSVARTVIAFQWRTPQRTVSEEEDSASVVHGLSLNRVWTPTRARVEVRVRNAIASVLSEDLPPESPLRLWVTELRPGSLPGYTERPRGTLSSYVDTEGAYRQLVVTQSGSTRACMDGDLAACSAALRLRLDDPRVSDWLSLEERQAMIQSGIGADGAFMHPDFPLVRACVEEDDEESCNRALREVVVWTPARPLGGPASTDLFWYAVRVGGVGAWERVLEMQESSPLDALTHIAGVGADELIGGWRAWVIESRPDVHAGLGTTRWATLFWVLVLGALAMRSTRWRLG